MVGSSRTCRFPNTMGSKALLHLLLSGIFDDRLRLDNLVLHHGLDRQFDFPIAKV